MAELIPALEAYFGHEGLYSDDPRDPGGETWMGIARAKQRGWRGWPLVDQAKEDLRVLDPGRPLEASDLVAALRADPDLQEAVGEFYGSQWRTLGLGFILDQGIAVEVFEAGQNVGPRRAISWLQAVLNVMNRQAKDWDEVEEDGRIGQQTLEALAHACSRRGPGSVELALNGRQFKHYWDLARRNPATWEPFFNGFLRRVSLRRRDPV